MDMQPTSQSLRINVESTGNIILRSSTLGHEFDRLNALGIVFRRLSETTTDWKIYFRFSVQTFAFRKGGHGRTLIRTLVRVDFYCLIMPAILILPVIERAGFSFPVHAHMLRHACGYALANA
jgi:hypothetical protein